MNKFLKHYLIFLVLLCLFLFCLNYFSYDIPFFDGNIYDMVLYDSVYNSIMWFFSTYGGYFVHFLTSSFLLFVLFLILCFFYYLGKFIFDFMKPIILDLHSRFFDWWYNHGKAAGKAFLKFIYHLFFLYLYPLLFF